MKIDKTFDTYKKNVWENTLKYIILHNTWWSLIWENQVNYLAKNKARVSAHFVIWQEENQVAQIWEETDILWHTWRSEWNWEKDVYGTLNSCSIWIEVVWPWFTDIQRKNTNELIIYLSEKYNIPKENILRHIDIAPNRKTDIEDEFWNDKFISFEEYKNSLFIWEYEKLFINNYWDSTVFNDLDWALRKCVNEDWTLNAREYFFLIMIWLERINK